MNIYIGADHRGFSLKEKLAFWLKKDNKIHDLGANKYDTKDDYPVFARKVSEKVITDKGGLGILLCGSGVGVDVVANKFDGIRASIGKTPAQVRSGRNDDDMNILVIASEYTSESEAKDMIRAFLTTSFSEEKRYKRRLDEIRKIEKNN
ncbi:RpiB/LacA/LacB family sugar-phosphate isomerase [Patescibacteria group bacterium]